VVQVIAHRGASLAERENTVGAYRRAAQMGADAVELDVRRTADGVLVVHHDAALDGGPVVATLSAGELPAYVPTLDEALDACAGMWVNVEIKNDPDDPDFDPEDTIAGDTVAALRRRGEDPRWLISSFRIETADRCRTLAPEIRTAWLVVEVPAGAAATCAARGHSALHPWVGTLTEAHIAGCHAAGVGVNTWTCDDPRRIGELAGWGLDGICTNVPDIALRALGRAPGPGRGEL
jgi:glycerophosphoryl diester phosphodiesterase